jgi:2-keto-3-deoxy-L-rhamnonate aldolase RhmA
MDPIMLMSIVNMKLRDDFGGDLDKLANFFDISKSALIEKLAGAGFDFLPEAGQFR